MCDPTSLPPLPPEVERALHGLVPAAMNGDLAEIVSLGRDIEAAFRAALAAVERELDEARAEVLRWEEREAAVCEEDVSFEDTIKAVIRDMDGYIAQLVAAEEREGALRRDLRALAERHESLERQFRGLYEKCRDGDEIAQDTAREARAREKWHRDVAADLAALVPGEREEHRAREEREGEPEAPPGFQWPVREPGTACEHGTPKAYLCPKCRAALVPGEPRRPEEQQQTSEVPDRGGAVATSGPARELTGNRTRCAGFPGDAAAGAERCCARAGEYNGFASDGPLSFICPKGCACHD